MDSSAPNAAAAATAPITRHTARFKYFGTGESLLGLVFVNGLLTLITLGFYSFWAKTKVRQFHYSHTDMDGDRFAYHGTGGELFKGALKAGAILFVIGLFWQVGLALGGGKNGQPMVAIAIILSGYLAIGALAIYAVNSARRYRLSRSSWRGIRFSYHGTAGEFAKLILRTGLLTIVTLGFYSPHAQTQRRAYFVANARFGSEPFMYDGEAGPLFKEYLKALLLMIPTLGLSLVWFSAFRHRYFWDHTTMRGARFRSTVTAPELLKLGFTNVLLVLFTLGIGAPWAVTRTHAFWCEKLSLHGTVDWAQIQQQAQAAGATGEGLADGLDVDVGIGM